ncbi:hypothetical protein BX600DRAFT_500711 [Xylariales sp. PMI_506]|nr:hypothetical protein BX600DRAFT_500711 [Xylariales sp. PMI_506]
MSSPQEEPDGCPEPGWGTEAFIERLLYFAKLTGPLRNEYYHKKLQGILDIHSFTTFWNEIYSQQTIPFWDQAFRLVAPPSWFNGFRDGRWVLTYVGDGPLSQGFDDLIKGPVTVDCGMWAVLILWVGIRSMVGDKLFNTFKFGKGKFTINQRWHERMNHEGTLGNLLYHLYDKVSRSQPQIWTRTLFNDQDYHSKHPGGLARLEHVTQIGDWYITFAPTASRNILTDFEIQEHLLTEYNAPQDLADKEQVRLYALNPGQKYQLNENETWGSRLKKAEEYATHTLTKAQWQERKVKRETRACNMNLAFNCQRLIRCLREALEEAEEDGYDVQSIDFLGNVKRAKTEAIFEVMNGT